jgi:hypothetical protein
MSIRLACVPEQRYFQRIACHISRRVPPAALALGRGRPIKYPRARSD